MNHLLRVLFAGTSLAAAGAAQAQTAAPSQAPMMIEEITVTASKRSDSINTVPMSITATSGEMLQALGVNSPEDLVKAVPGFTFTPSPYSTPVYSLRGVGYYDYTIGAAPAVSIYVDEAPLPFSTMARGAAIDLERVEVLKGPQGTLFGSNSTGGAINYIAAKPTREFQAGFDASYGRFDTVELGGYVSGPLSEDLAARVAVRREQSGDWQRSTTRDDTLGSRDFTAGRLSFAWAPREALSVNLAVGGFVDKSDAQAGQLIQINPLIPGLELPSLAALPLPGNDARAADWTAGFQPKHDAKGVQASLRVDYDLASALKLTTLTSYGHFEQDDRVDPDATSLVLVDTLDTGLIDALFQEVRLTGEWGPRLRWIGGVNYELNRVKETQVVNASEASGFRSFMFFGVPIPDGTPISSSQRFETKAVFANLDFDATDTVALHGGLRYSDSKIDFTGCTGDSANGSLSTGLNIILGGGLTFAPGGCTTLGPDLKPARSQERLAQDNVSWRIGADWKPAPRTLLYANISQGYKTGAFPLLPSTSTAQNAPVVQEGLLAYEAGFKLTLAERTLQLNGAVFYYDYKDKQTQGSVVLTPNIFGPLNNLVNIPKSEIRGAELQTTWTPLRGLTLGAAGTYVDSKIGNFSNFDPYGVVRNFKGESFPNTPKWQGSASADYEWPLRDDLNAFVGANLTYRSGANGSFGDYPILKIKSYALLDLRAGVESKTSGWKASVWGRNVTDEYYWTTAYKIADVTARFAGQPATYGVSLSMKY